MAHAFISYVREDSALVDKLSQALRENGVTVWLDRNDIRPGQDWPNAIRDAIEKGAFFIACFSHNYLEKKKTHMNEELILAVETLRKMQTNQVWFIPVMLSNCDIPNRSIGAGRTLSVFQKADLYTNWDDGITRILSTVQPGAVSSRRKLDFLFRVKHESNANAVEVCGDFNNWNGVKMKKVGNSFEATISLSAGKHEFKFKVDGKWREEMVENYNTVPNDQGTQNYVIDIA